MNVRDDAGGRTVLLGNPDKVLFPDAGITKRELFEYYRAVADVLLPHARGRPLTMHRFPDGIDGHDFIQQNVPDHFPDWVGTVTVPKAGGQVTHVVCDDLATLLYLADQACITPHVWLSTVDDLDRPDRLVFDLDPPEGSPDADPVRFAARALRELLDDLGLGSRIMTTGSKGFHVVVPLEARWRFDEVRAMARDVADVLVARHPDHLTVQQRIDRRGGRVFLDYLRNAYGQTTVAPYAVRGKPGAPVATPIDWDELGRTGPRTYTLPRVRRRLAQKADPWAVDGIEGQSLDAARDTLRGLED